ncbi:unnamed protein product, partial [Dibothriocephalus latus]
MLRLLCSSNPVAASPGKHSGPQLYAKPPNIYCRLPNGSVFAEGRKQRCLDQLLLRIRAIADPNIYT